MSEHHSACRIHEVRVGVLPEDCPECMMMHGIDDAAAAHRAPDALAESRMHVQGWVCGFGVGAAFFAPWWAVAVSTVVGLAVLQWNGRRHL